MKKTRGITLVALVVTIVVLLILVGITINYTLGDNGIFKQATNAKEQTEIAVAREKLEMVLNTNAAIQKHTNPIYNQDEFLDSFILEKIKGSEMIGDIAIVDGYAFGIDRSVPKIGEYLGKREELIFPTVEATMQLVEDNKRATITITALEEKNGIHKIEIWQKGERLDEFPYENIKTIITKEYTVNQNGTYVIKAYGKLSVSKIVEVKDILPSVAFEPNGSTEWKKSHSTVVKIEETEDKIVKAKYQWTNSVAIPEDNEFPDNQTFQSSDKIMKTGVTGTYYLWIMLEAETGKKVKWRSEEFYFDNEEPSITVFTATKYSEIGITLSATAQDNKSGIVKFEFYIDGEAKNDYTQIVTATTGSVTKTVTITGLTTGNHNCEVRVYDAENTSNTKSVLGTTKLYTWNKYNTIATQHYGLKLTGTETLEFGWYADTKTSFSQYKTCSAQNNTGKLCLINQISSYLPQIGAWRSHPSRTDCTVKLMEEVSRKDHPNGAANHMLSKYLCEVYMSEKTTKSFKKGSTFLGTITSTSNNSFPNGRRER